RRTRGACRPLSPAGVRCAGKGARTDTLRRCVLRGTRARAAARPRGRQRRRGTTRGGRGRTATRPPAPSHNSGTGIDSMRPSYLDVRGEPVLAFLHPARGVGPAVLLCPPCGREDAASYRSRREWAENLAANGIPVLRLDLPATGDSGGRIDEPGRLASWIE